MKETLRLPPNLKGTIWLYNKERFLDLFYQSFLHHHEELELNIVVRGRGIYLLNSRKFDLAPGSLIWLFPEQEHLLVEKSLDFEMWILVMRPDGLREICLDREHAVLLEGNPQGSFCRSLAQHQLQRLAGLCREALAAQADLSLFNASVSYILLSAWAAYQAASGLDAARNIVPAVERAARLIRERGDAADLGFLAQEVGLSPSSLSRLFKKQVGVSLTTFRNRCRVEQFLNVYGDGRTRNMLDAALEAGFGSYAQFYRVFKQIMGGTPSDFRRGRS